MWNGIVCKKESFYKFGMIFFLIIGLIIFFGNWRWQIQLEEKSFELFEYMEQGAIERIQKNLSMQELCVIEKSSVGEDTKDNIKRFYFCGVKDKETEDFYSRFYLVDYLTGEIYDLNKKVLEINIADMPNQREEQTMDYKVWIEDLDGNKQEDILVVVYRYVDWKDAWENRIYLWLESDGEYEPFHSESGWIEEEKADFSEQIKIRENNFCGKEAQKEWKIERVADWVKEELARWTKSLQKEIPYKEQRVAENIQVDLIQDANGNYSVSIPKIQYSEEKINHWFQEFYKEEAKNEEDFMGIGIEENDIYLSEQMRKEAQFFYNTSLEIERVDDAVISVSGMTDTYSGGAHGNVNSFSVTFDTKTGKILTLKDLFFDLDSFYYFALRYIEDKNSQNVEWTRWWMNEYIRKAIWKEQWYLSDTGIVFFLNGINGLGVYTYEIPYQSFADKMKIEYLPAK